MFGGTPEQLEEARAALEKRKATGVYEVWPENWRAFDLFRNLGTQWSVVGAGMAGLFYTGINYSSLPEVERRVPPADDDESDPSVIFQQLRFLEAEALQYLNQRG